MLKRKMNKDKEQIRNYYFNSLKVLRSTARIDGGFLKIFHLCLYHSIYYLCFLVFFSVIFFYLQHCVMHFLMQFFLH